MMRCASRGYLHCKPEIARACSGCIQQHADAIRYGERALHDLFAAYHPPVFWMCPQIVITCWAAASLSVPGSESSRQP